MIEELFGHKNPNDEETPSLDDAEDAAIMEGCNVLMKSNFIKVLLKSFMWKVKSKDNGTLVVVETPISTYNFAPVPSCKKIVRMFSHLFYSL